ncbi:MAG TPA: hypothetical protein VGF29_15400 [Hyphomicrobiaceae bacterium]|jgi:hypothetical protein
MIMRAIATARMAHVLLPAALAIAGATVLAPAARDHAAAAPLHVAFAAANDGLPGDGRPPSPGPTDPYGAY